jgi:hypothetical protein
MKVVKVEWKRRRIMKQHLEEVFMTLSDGTVLVADNYQKPLHRGEDRVFITSENVPEDMQAPPKNTWQEITARTTNDPEIIGLVSEFIYAIKNGEFIEKVEVR